MILGVFLITAAPFAIGWLLFIASRFRELDQTVEVLTRKLEQESKQYERQRTGFIATIENLKMELRWSEEQNHHRCAQERNELEKKLNVCEERLFVAQEELRVLRAKDAKGEHLMRALELVEKGRGR